MDGNQRDDEAPERSGDLVEQPSEHVAGNGLRHSLQVAYGQGSW
ncbi:hypothetical protein ACFY2J_38750 [Streptomyces collinus]